MSGEWYELIVVEPKPAFVSAIISNIVSGLLELLGEISMSRIRSSSGDCGVRSW